MNLRDAVIENSTPRAPESGGHTLENRWCEHWGYYIDIAACEARADRRRGCRRCLSLWRQCSFPFFEEF